MLTRPQAHCNPLLAKIWSVLQHETKSGPLSTCLLSWSCEVASTYPRSWFGVQLSLCELRRAWDATVLVLWLSRYRFCPDTYKSHIQYVWMVAVTGCPRTTIADFSTEQLHVRIYLR